MDVKETTSQRIERITTNGLGYSSKAFVGDYMGIPVESFVDTKISPRSSGVEGGDSYIDLMIHLGNMDDRTSSHNHKSLVDDSKRVLGLFELNDLKNHWYMCGQPRNRVELEESLEKLAVRNDNYLGKVGKLDSPIKIPIFVPGYVITL